MEVMKDGMVQLEIRKSKGWACEMFMGKEGSCRSYFGMICYMEIQHVMICFQRVSTIICFILHKMRQLQRII